MNNVLKLLLIIDLVAVNVLLGYLVYKSQLPNVATQTASNDQVSSNLGGEVNTKDIEEMRTQMGTMLNRIGNLELTPYPSPAGSSGQIKTVTVLAPTKIPAKNISYVNIPGNGETNKSVWTDISGTDFYFDKAEYAGFLNVTLEGSIKLFNGNGLGNVRLFDMTHGIAVVGSEISTTGQSDTLASSGLLNVWSGKNLYRIQGKSNSSDRLIYNWGKLKITTQN